jgi:hypothetical protein
MFTRTILWHSSLLPAARLEKALGSNSCISIESLASWNELEGSLPIHKSLSSRLTLGRTWGAQPCHLKSAWLNLESNFYFSRVLYLSSGLKNLVSLTRFFSCWLQAWGYRRRRRRRRPSGASLPAALPCEPYRQLLVSPNSHSLGNAATGVLFI